MPSENVKKVVAYFDQLSLNESYPTAQFNYNHIGAIISDSILQAGLNYFNVVYPRVLKLLKSFPDYSTTSDFIILFKSIPLETLLDWKGSIKLNRIEMLSWFLFNEKVETQEDLAEWLKIQENESKLLNIKGIGPKTIDYLKTLAGVPAIPIDRHLNNFLNLAGVKTTAYNEANELYKLVAEELELKLYDLDKKIWTYMSTKKASAL